MKLPLKTDPKKICILRLSAVGDICHMLPIIRTIQKYWPKTQITWIIGRLEYSLVSDIPDIKFIIFDKSNGLSAYRSLQKKIKNEYFDVLLHMQMSFRSSLASLLISAGIKLGFDRKFAKDLQWLFTNHKLNAHKNAHVIDNFFNFIETLGLHNRNMLWDLPIPQKAIDFIEQLLPDKNILIISPCSSMSYRNWTIEGYAEIANYAQSKYDFCVILTGGNSKLEIEYGKSIQSKANVDILNLINKTNLKELCALISRSNLLLSPDSGPAHIATAYNIPVIGLYATTNPLRAQPYLSHEYTINKYDAAVLNHYKKKVSDLPWGIRVKTPGTMATISIQDVIEKIDLYCLNNNVHKL